MKVLHTSDWHLGHSLHGCTRNYEHSQFLLWLLNTLEEHKVDALMIAGDIFDSANPSAAAQNQWYEFLAEARTRFPKLDMVIIGGNHDSAGRLDAPLPLLKAFNIHMVGGLNVAGRSGDALEDLLVPLHGPTGLVEAWVAAVPYLRTSDLPRVDSSCDDPLIEGVRRLYSSTLEALEQKKEGKQALIAMGHCYMVDTTINELSERRILGGNQHALPPSIFGESLNYVALGHLHKAQRVGQQEHIRYCGSPIPLSLSEVHYRHQVLLADFEQGALQGVESIYIPRFVPMFRLPSSKAQPLDVVLEELKALPLAANIDKETSPKPYLEVRVLLDQPAPDLRARIEGALEDKWVRLVKLTVSYGGSGEHLADAVPHTALKEIKAEEVFRLQFKRKYPGEPPPPLMDAFAELLEGVEQGERP